MRGQAVEQEERVRECGKQSVSGDRSSGRDQGSSLKVRQGFESFEAGGSIGGAVGLGVFKP